MLLYLDHWLTIFTDGWCSRGLFFAILINKSFKLFDDFMFTPWSYIYLIFLGPVNTNELFLLFNCGGDKCWRQNWLLGFFVALFIRLLWKVYFINFDFITSKKKTLSSLSLLASSEFKVDHWRELMIWKSLFWSSVWILNSSSFHSKNTSLLRWIVRPNVGIMLGGLVSVPVII